MAMTYPYGAPALPLILQQARNLDPRTAPPFMDPALLAPPNATMATQPQPVSPLAGLRSTPAPVLGTPQDDATQRRGRMNSALSNVLLMGGLGMLGQGASRTPINPFSGFAQGAGFGLEMADREAALAQEQERADAELKMKRAALEEKRAQREAAAEARRATGESQAELLVAQGRAPDIETAQRMVTAGVADEYLKPQAPEKDPLAAFNAYQQMTPEQQARFRDYKRAGSPTTTIQNIPAGYEPAPGGGLQYVSGGPADPNRVQPAELRERRAQDRAKAEVSQLLDSYVAMANPRGLYGTDADAAGALRREMAEKVARIRQPTGILTESDISRVEQDLFDVGGPLDAARAEERANNLRRIWGLPESGLRRVTDEVGVGPPPPAGFVED